VYIYQVMLCNSPMIISNNDTSQTGLNKFLCVNFIFIFPLCVNFGVANVRLSDDGHVLLL
jgi:hypothetical protein